MPEGRGISAVPVSYTFRIFLPLIFGNGPKAESPNYPPSQPRPVPPSSDESPEERELALLLMRHPEQERPMMVRHPIVAAVARARSRDMAERNYFNHVNPDGYGANCLIEMAGYDLPSYYPLVPISKNSCESLAAGQGPLNGRSGAERCLEGLYNSADHNPHILGKGKWYHDQTVFGIGYWFDAASTYDHYWTILTVHPEEQ